MAVGTTAATREWTAAAAANWQKKKKLEDRKRGRDLTRDTTGLKRPRTAAVGESTSDDVAKCIQRGWAAARALDAERDATTGRGVDGRAREAVGRRDAGGVGTKRPAATDDGRADENGLQSAMKKQYHGGRLEKLSKNERNRLNKKQRREQEGR